MQSNSEIECAFIIEGLAVESFLSACRYLKLKGFNLDIKSPGYIYDEYFLYPEWKSLDKACEQIKNGFYKFFGINICLLNSQDDILNSLSIEVDVENRSISLKMGEEIFIDQESKKIKRNAFICFVRLSQDLSLQLSVKAWKIAQTGFEYNVSDGGFFNYEAGNAYPLEDIEGTISWYENQYLTRWQ